MAVVVVGAFIGAIVGFVLIYAAVRMGVTDALRSTVNPALLIQEPEDHFRLDEGDDASEQSASSLRDR